MVFLSLIRNFACMKESRSSISQEEQRRYKRLLWALLLLAALVVATLLVLPHIPPSKEGMQRSTALLERSTFYEVSLDGQAMFQLSDNDNWTISRMSVNMQDTTVAHVEQVTGTWLRRTFQPFCRGRLMVAAADTSLWNTDKAARAAAALPDQREVLLRRIEAMEKRIEELQYFMKVHGVTDEGFNVVADWHQIATEELQNVRQVMEVLNDSTHLERMTVSLVQKYTLLHTNSAGQIQRIPCHIIKTAPEKGYCIVQTQNHWMPNPVSPQYNSTAVRALRHQHDSLLRLPKDTLNASLWMAADSTSYKGETNANWQPAGHGIMRSWNGKVYDGMWKDGKRHGFGISMDSDGRLRVGEWKEDVYQGERLMYTVEHVYGIDISRYQHEKGKKKYAIDWSRLRISSLGTLSKKRISGVVDYPVSFCFVKATEGTTIRNAYYVSDCMQARRRGIEVGSYHFFSLKSSPREQATAFLRYARFPKGDLPPVLDVEPTNAQIRAYGGTEKLLQAIRTWLQIVEQQVGVRPILYVNQGFVTKHLADATDMKRDYQVWIARYGEYKPDVRLAIWQLSPDGRVAGIRGEVDINVFNGYRDQYEEFLETHCIK